jgi:uncharacterized protein (DUF3084 family)
MDKLKSQAKELKKTRTFLEKEIARFDKFIKKHEEKSAKDGGVLRGYIAGMSGRRAEARKALEDVENAIRGLGAEP